MKGFYEYRYAILFTVIACIGFLAGIAVGLNSLN